MSRYEIVLRWFVEYGFTIIKKDYSSISWRETIMKDLNGKIRKFEITNNHIWYIKNDRTSFGKTKKELYLNLDKRFKGGINNVKN